jgi:hypothetical protein
LAIVLTECDARTFNNIQRFSATPLGDSRAFLIHCHETFFRKNVEDLGESAAPARNRFAFNANPFFMEVQNRHRKDTRRRDVGNEAAMPIYLNNAALQKAKRPT